MKSQHWFIIAAACLTTLLAAGWWVGTATEFLIQTIVWEQTGDVGTGAVSPSKKIQEIPYQKPIRMIAGLPATVMIGKAIAENTRIQIDSPFPLGLQMQDQEVWLEENAKTTKALFDQADATITLRRVWREDPLYGYVRRANGRVVEIDASRPFEPHGKGVSVLATPQGALESRRVSARSGQEGEPSIWMSLDNASRMAEIMAQEFLHWDPEAEAQLAMNLAQFKKSVFELKAHFEEQLLEIETPEAIAFFSGAAYLLQNVNVYDAGYVLKDEYYWNDVDMQKFEALLDEVGVPVAVHRFEPNDAIQDQLRRFGVKIVIINPLTAAGGDYLNVMRSNLNSLLDAL